MRQRETKAERFVRVAEQRTQRAVDAIHSLSNCASRVCYVNIIHVHLVALHKEI